MALRILTAAILIPLVIALVWYGPLALLAALAALVALLALWEFFGLGERVGLHAYRVWTLLSAAILFYSQYSVGLTETHALGQGVSIIRNVAGGVLPLDAVLLIFLFGAVAISLATRRPLGETLPGLAVSSAGLIFIALPFSYLVRMIEMERIGRQLVLFTLVLVWAGDTAAYFVGHSVGRLKMAPVLSPKKTWEGAFANLGASLLVAAIFARWMSANLLSMLIIAALANLAGQLGDLIESAYKRGAAVKDSGDLLPGHGGMLDRIDALMFACPIVWATYQWMARSGALLG